MAAFGQLYNLALAAQNSGQLYQPNGSWASQPYDPQNPADWGVNPSTGGSWFDQNGFSGSTSAAPFTAMNGATQITDPASQLPPWAGTNTGGSTGGSGSSAAASMNPYASAQDPGQAWINSGGKTTADFANFVQQWNASHGPQDQLTITGSAGGGATYHGVNYDAVIGSHLGGTGAWWNGPGSGGASSGGGTFGSGGFGSGTFTAPTLADAQNSPGYQFALDQGMKAIQNSAAAKGTLLTGGTLKALQGYGTGLADQTYQNVFNNAATTHGINTSDLFNLASLGKPS